MLYTLSRYTYGSNSDVDGKLTAVKKPSFSVAVQTYRTAPGDTFENIAARVYGDSSQYWRIADINPQIKFPLDLTPGTVIRIPQ